jgi:hypothetical protein
VETADRLTWASFFPRGLNLLSVQAHDKNVSQAIAGLGLAPTLDVRQFQSQHPLRAMWFGH